jgi:hypothetical protein
MRLIRDKLLSVSAALIPVLAGGAGWAGEEESFEATASSIDVADVIEIECLRANGPFSWNCAGLVAGVVCTQILEPQDPDTWTDNYFCASSDLGMRWSFAGPISGMRCTSIYEPAEPPGHTWRDNYLCVPPDSHYHFLWSYAGPLMGQNCLQWFEPVDPNTWGDNYLCWMYF